METLLLSYFAAIILLTITPGVDTALIIRTASVEGRRQAFWGAAGIHLGCLAWGAAAAFGLGAILAASETAFTVLKWCGALYLIWLGLQLLFSAKAQDFTALPAAHAAQPNWFIRGFSGNLLNPKFIVIGGGVSAAGDFLLKRVDKYFKENTFPNVRETTSLRLATLGNTAGVIGAASLALK